MNDTTMWALIHKACGHTLGAHSDEAIAKETARLGGAWIGAVEATDQQLEQLVTAGPWSRCRCCRPYGPIVARAVVVASGKTAFAVPKFDGRGSVDGVEIVEV